MVGKYKFVFVIKVIIFKVFRVVVFLLVLGFVIVIILIFVLMLILIGIGNILFIFEFFIVFFKLEEDFFDFFFC